MSRERWIAHRARRAGVVALLVFVAACGGDAEVAEDIGVGTGDDVGEALGDTDPAQSGSAGGEVGPVTETADPSTGWFETGGARYEFAAIGSVNYVCDVLEDRVTINFQQTTSGSQLTVQGSVLDGTWTGNLTFSPGEETQVSYGATIGFDPGTLGLGGDALSYSGSMSRVEDFDVQTAEEVQGTLAVNCADPGGGTTAEIGGESFEFPFSGASTLRCSVADSTADVLISSSFPERRQIQVDVQDQGDELFGAITVTAGESTYSSFVPPDGAGLTFDDNGLSYEGVFTTPDEQEVEGSVVASCG